MRRIAREPAEIIHGFERFELWIIRGRERLADVDTEDTWGDLRTWDLGAGTPGVTNHLDLANLPLGCFGIVLV